MKLIKASLWLSPLIEGEGGRGKTHLNMAKELPLNFEHM